MTLKKIRAALAKLANALGINEKLLARAQRRYQANHKRAFKANRQKEAAQKKADELRAEAHKCLEYTAESDQAKGERLLRKAARKDKKALRLATVATNNHNRAQHFLGVVKDLTGRIEGLDKRRTELRAELKKLKHVSIAGNHATGGTPRERLKAVALSSAANCASGKRANFYSQAGAYDAEHCITGPAYGHRDDCSSWFASVYYSAGLPDPSGEDFKAGYTGTLGAHGREINVSQLRPGDAILYGPYPHHHVEMYVGPGNKTIGHGSAPVDAGVIDLFGDGDYHCRSFV